ncbi:tRNA (N6-isopentenyl adenosine(37)-C2)-methylthiotransferase MiaB [Candidatus Uhrbacteria bacterium RIFCSPLOWO2_12_FULL_47_9]|nr:MAG: tRNA (N6-isopentenyl adenosine(37)-C2)-methylthiotransferase MiaB [Candidatus Uhrbacteria bacterium RIFCSPLOWO2_12_FULL_47_9]
MSDIKPKFHLITYGCQMNKNDSERMEALLHGLGFASTDTPAEADLILINTCSVRQQAEDRVFGKVHEFEALKETNPKLILGITGCMAGRDRDGVIRKKIPSVDLYFRTADMGQLPRWIGELRPELVNSTDLVEDYLKINPERRSVRQAFVSIQTGCNKFCTYCVVPFARGLEKNRSVKDILDEVRDLAAHGCIEVTLLGQTVNSYLAPDVENFSEENSYQNHFAKLLWEVNQIPDIKRLHFTAPHPLHMTDEVIDAMTLPAHVNFIHLPVQAGDNEVLRRMNRRYTIEQFHEVIGRLRAKIPNLAIGTDIIVGFSGESPEQFQKTIDLYRDVKFDIGYTARYSERSGTAAKRAFKDDVTQEEKKRRWNELQAVMEEVVREKNKQYVDEIVSVLVERHEAPKITDEMLAMPEKIQELLAAQPGMCFGNSREMKLVTFVGGKELVGEIVNVKITKAETWILEGQKT